MSESQLARSIKREIDGALMDPEMKANKTADPLDKETFAIQVHNIVALPPDPPEYGGDGVLRIEDVITDIKVSLCGVAAFAALGKLTLVKNYKRRAKELYTALDSLDLVIEKSFNAWSLIQAAGWEMEGWAPSTNGEDGSPAPKPKPSQTSGVKEVSSANLKDTVASGVTLTPYWTPTTTKEATPS